MGQQLSSDSGAWGYGLDTPFGRQPGSQPLFLSAATGGNDQGARGGQWAGISGDPLNTFTERTVSMIICKGNHVFLIFPGKMGILVGVKDGQSGLSGSLPPGHTKALEGDSLDGCVDGGGFTSTLKGGLWGCSC